MAKKKKKSSIDVKAFFESHPDLTDKLAIISKDFSEKVQDLIKNTNIEATVKVSFSFDVPEERV